MNRFKEIFLADLQRYEFDIHKGDKGYKGNKDNKTIRIRHLRNPRCRMLYLFRKAQYANNGIVRFICSCLYMHTALNRGIEIPTDTKIGRGLYLGHAFNITVNSKATIGCNCNLNKGVTIGLENRGKRKGTPTIGDKVWIGANATVVGNITIGDDVLIAPNSYVNCDIPSHSVVYGNPCIIKQRHNATEGYIELMAR